MPAARVRSLLPLLLVVACAKDPLTPTSLDASSDRDAASASDASARGRDASAPADAAAASDTCTPCVTSDECGADHACAQLAGDSFCTPLCPIGACPADDRCVTLTDTAGLQIEACAPTTGICALPEAPDAGPLPDAAPQGEQCGALSGPDLSGCCHSCQAGSGRCQANGCYGGWFCNADTCHCQAPPDPSTCTGGRPDASAAPDASERVDAGPVTASTVDQNGGRVDLLRFAIVGDTRPPLPDDTRGYPTAVITQIWQDVAAERPQPAFAVTTGDYMFATGVLRQADPQMDIYLHARAAFPNVVFYALGNHECTGSTSSNCGPGNRNGVTHNYDVFLRRMVQAIGKTQPYFSVRVDANDGSWTSKLVFVAPNAWDEAQASWLETAMSDSTTYTFVVRHEGVQATQAPGVSPSADIMARHPYTLLLAGHTHTFEYNARDREVITGTGGAPLSGSINYGYTMVERQADGTIRVEAKDYATGQVLRSFAVHADGTPAP